MPIADGLPLSPSARPLDQPQSPPLDLTASSSGSQLKQISVPLSLSTHTTLHIQVNCFESSILAFLTTTDPSNTAALSSLGSFVYSMPNVSKALILLTWFSLGFLLQYSNG